MVKRYGWEYEVTGISSGWDLEEKSDGDYVLYEDYKKLEEENKRLVGLLFQKTNSDDADTYFKGLQNQVDKWKR